MLSIPFLRNRMLASPKVLLQPRAIIRGRHSLFLKNRRGLVPCHSFPLPVCNRTVALSSLRTATSTAITPKTPSKTAPCTANPSIDPMFQRYQSFCERAWNGAVREQGTLEQYWARSSSQTQFGKLVYADNQLLLRFSGRDNLASQMEDVILKRLRRPTSPDQQSCPLLFTVGGPGFGKSRILDEVWNRVGQTSSDVNVQKAVEQSVSFKVTFGNQSSLEQPETNYSLALAARILFSRMQYAFGSYQTTYEIWLQFCSAFQSEFQDLCDPIASTLNFVLEHTLQRRAGQTLVYLAIDEIQRVIPYIEDETGPTRTFIQELSVLSNTLLKGGQSTIIHLGGLYLGEVISESLGAPPVYLLPSAVSEIAILDAFDGANYLRSDDPPEEKSKFKSSEWPEFSPVRLALAMVGGHFRCLEFLCNAFGLLDPESRELASAQRPVYLMPTTSPHGWAKFVEYAQNIVGDNSHRPEVLPLAACAILKGGEYPPEIEDYVRTLKSRGILELDVEKRHFRITPMFLYTVARGGLHGTFADMSHYFGGNLIKWKGWEQMNTEHIRVRIRLWPYSSSKSPTVKELFPGEWGKEKRQFADPDCQFAVELPYPARWTFHLSKLDDQWPTMPTHAALATKQSAASTLLSWPMVRLEGNDIERKKPKRYVVTSQELLEAPFMTAANSVVDAFQFTNNALFLFQYKHTSKDGKSQSLDRSTVLEEYAKVQTSMQQFNDVWFLIIITNQNFDALHSQELPTNCCVIAADHLDCYFGPLATVAQRLPFANILKRKQRSR